MIAKRVLALVGVTALLTVVGSVGAQSAMAANPPWITLSQPTFTHYNSDFASYPDFNNWDAGITFHWAVHAPSGICSQSLTYANYDALGGDVDPILHQDSLTVKLSKTARSYAAQTDTMDFSRAGFSVVVRMKECNGKTVSSNPVHTVVEPGEDSDSVVSYSGAWAISRCSCWSDGTTHRTTAKNASVSFHTVRPLDGSGVAVALIMAKASNRGSAAVYVDGVKKATVNTYSKSAVNRAIVYQIVLTGTATHTVKIVNLATAGHPRIDFDAAINGG